MAPTMKGPVPVVVHPADATLQYINSNPYFIGIMMLMLNLGGRFISLELSKTQEAFFQNPWVRRFLIFTVLFVGTRNVAIAFWLTLLVVLVLGHLLNENSSLCIYTGLSQCKSAGQQTSGPTHPIGMVGMPPQPMQAVPGLSHEESSIYKTLHDKMARATMTLQKNDEEKAKEKEKDKQKKEEASSAQQYLQNMMMLRAEGFTNPRF